MRCHVYCTERAHGRARSVNVNPVCTVTTLGAWPCVPCPQRLPDWPRHHQQWTQADQHRFGASSDKHMHHDLLMNACEYHSRV